MKRRYYTGILCGISLALSCFPILRIAGLVLLFGMTAWTSMEYIRFKNSIYSIKTKNAFLAVFFDAGMYGEFDIVRTVEKVAPGGKILTNLYLPSAGNSSIPTEIDVVLISKGGCFVFESKNYTGQISGDSRGEVWTNMMTPNKTVRFCNPFWQNAGHVNAVNKISSYRYKNKVQNVVVFGRRAKLLNVKVLKKDGRILEMARLAEFIRAAQKTQVLNKEDIDTLYKLLKKYEKPRKRVLERHQKHVKARRAEFIQKNGIPRKKQAAVSESGR